MIRLENWRYATRFEGGQWRLHGTVYDHPYIADGKAVWPSTPVYFQRDLMLLRTKSGSEYILGNCSGDLNEEVRYIIKDIARGHYQRM